MPKKTKLSAQRAARQAARREEINKARHSAVKTVRVMAIQFIEGEKDVGEAEKRAREAIAEIDRAAAKGVLHKNNAARLKSRLMGRLNKVKAAAS